jgi:hypothetical protein
LIDFVLRTSILANIFTLTFPHIFKYAAKPKDEEKKDSDA